MIKVVGSARRSFVFPGELPLTYAYYADVGRLLSYLPHICLVRAYGPDRFRLLYSSTELGLYHVRIFADVQAVLEEGWVIRVRPLVGIPPIEAQAGIHATTTQGHFSSQSVFHDEGDRTRIEYNLQLHGNLPMPPGLRLMPRMVVGRIAKRITKMRIREIADGFVERSSDAFPHWLAEMHNDASWQEPGEFKPTYQPEPDCPDELL
jgi:hypothetical protein